MYAKENVVFEFLFCILCMVYKQNLNIITVTINILLYRITILHMQQCYHYIIS